MIPKKWILASFIAFAFLLFVNNDKIPFWDQDESAYAGFAYNMLENNDWCIPDFYFSEVHRKPPLHFWVIALFNKIWGYNEFAVRISSALAVFVTLLLVYFQGKKFFGEKQSFYSSWVLAGSILVTSIGKIAVTDSLVLLFSTSAAFSMLNVLHFKDNRWVWVFWVSISLGVLAKGPPVLLFSGAMGLLLFIFHPLRWNLVRLHPWFFLPFSLIPFIYWAYCTYLQDGGEFLRWMYHWYIVKRIDGHVFGQTGPPGMHFILLCCFFIFYVRYIPSAIVDTFKKAFSGHQKFLILMLWWIAGWLFYEFSPSKLPAYIIAAHVPFALMIGQIMVNVPNNLLSKVGFTMQVLTFASLIFVAGYAYFSIDLHQNFKLPIIILGIYLTVWLASLIINRKSNNYPLYHLVGAWGFLLSTWLLAPKATSLINSSKQIAQLCRENYPKMKVLIAYNFGQQPSLPYYLLNHGLEVENVVGMDIDEILDHNDDFVLVANEEQFFAVKNKCGKDLPFEQIQTFIIDRHGMTDYYIVPIAKCRH